MSTNQDSRNVTPLSAGSTAVGSTTSTSTAASPQSNLRSKVIEMLASTLNNGFSELGMSPDHFSTVHAIYEWNKRLSAENARLFADNRRLSQLIGLQNTRITAQGGGKDTTAHELQTRLQEIELSRYDVMRQNEQLAQEVMVLRAEVHRLSQILLSKGMAHEVANLIPSISGQRPMAQPTMPAHHPGHISKARHPQLYALSTSYSAQTVQSAPIMQVPALPAYHAGQPIHPLANPAQLTGRRNANGPVMASFLQDPRTMARVYVDSSSRASSSRPNTAPTRAMQASTTIVDLTGEPDSEEEKRSTKKARVESAAATSSTVATPPAVLSTPQTRDADMSATPVAQQAPSANEHDITLEWLNMDGPVLEQPNEDVRMGSPVQEAQQMPMDVVEQAQTLLEAPPTANDSQTESAQQPAVGAPSASGDQLLSMQTDAQPTQESLDPSAEVIQQCIDENFVEFDAGQVGEGPSEGAPSPGSRMCRMCQIRYVRGLSDKAPDAFAADTSTEELARHCQQEHPKGWIVLLQRCMEDDESDEDE